MSKIYHLCPILANTGKPRQDMMNYKAIIMNARLLLYATKTIKLDENRYLSCLIHNRPSVHCTDYDEHLSFAAVAINNVASIAV